MLARYEDAEPSRAEVDAHPGVLLLEFGAPWCPHCIVGQRAIDAALARFSGFPHIRCEDGPGKPLGRSFRVKLWPTLVVLRDGVELARVVRPTDEASVHAALAAVGTA